MNKSELLPSSRRVTADLVGLAPTVRRWSALVGGLAFAASLAEAGMFVVLTATADAAIRPERQLSFLGSEVGLNAAIAVGLGLIVLKVALAVAGSTVSMTYARHVLESLRARLTQALLEAAPLLVQAEKGGMMQDRLTTWCERVASITETFGSIVAASLSLAAFLLVAALVDVRAVALLVLLGLVVAGAIRPIIGRIRHAADRLRAETNAYAGDVGETAMVGTEIAAFGVGEEFGRSLDRSSIRAAHAWWKARLMTMVLPHAYQSITMVMLFLAVAYVAWDDSPAAPARLGAVVLLLIRCVGLGQQVITYRAKFVNDRPFVTGVREELDSLSSARNPPGTTSIDRINEIALEDVAFSYAEVPALRDVSLLLRRGTSLAIVGPSGAGKTTLARLLLRHASPTSGTIRIDGVALSDITKDSWAALAAPVSQQPVMVTGTVADNVRFYREIERPAIERACATAGILDNINNLPDGFNTMLHPASGPLSGGQRQRLALARALCADPQLVVLDEPTSALDVASEQVIADAIAALRGLTTTVIVAHRWATVAHCEQVLVLTDGRQVAAGPTADVLEQSAFLRSMSSGPPEKNVQRVD